AFTKENVIHFARNEDDLTTCSVRGWRSGFYNQLIIVDCMGITYTVYEAKRVGYVGFLWGFSLAYGQKIRIKLICRRNTIVYSITDFKIKMSKQLKKDMQFWNSGGNADELVSRINSAKSFNDI